MSQSQICILGGSGFVGQHLATQLNALGITSKILTRQRAKHKNILVLPRCEIVETDVYNTSSLSSHFEQCHTVINLVGILNESGHDGHGFRKAHVDLTRNVLQAAQQVGVKKILHMSALNADAAKGLSCYLRTKGEAEDYLHTFHGDIDVTSFRPSVIFGPGDSFFNRFATLLKLSPLFFPLACPNARFAPVYVGDVTEQFIRALNDSSYKQKRINLCGPDIYTLRELVEYTATALGLRRRIIGLPSVVAKIQALLMDYLVPTKPFSLDNYHSLLVDSICSDSPPMPTGIDAVVPGYLSQDNERGHYHRYRQYARRH